MSRDVLDRHRSLRLLVTLVVIALAYYLFTIIWSTLVLFGDIILLFLLSWIIAFILDPVSQLLQRYRIPRIAAVAIIYFALLIAVSGGIVLAIPAIESQIKTLAGQLTNAVSASNLPELSNTLVQFLRRFGLSQHAAQQAVDQASQQLPQRVQDLANNAVAVATGLVASLLTIIFDFSLVLIMSFYIMLDGNRLAESLVQRLPPRWIPDVRLFQRYVQDIFAGYFRAQLIVVAIYAALTWLILFILGAPDGILPAVVAGLLMLLPFVGPVLAIVPPALIIFLQGSDNPLVKLLILALLLIIAQQIVLNLIAPRIFGRHMGVPPLVLFAALLLGTKQGGVWGAFFAGPIVAVGWAMVEVFYTRFREHSALFKPLDLPEAVEDTTMLPHYVAPGNTEGASQSQTPTTEPSPATPASGSGR